MILAGLALAATAAVFHVFVFVLESLHWTKPQTRRVFGVKSEADALTTKQLAFNQGFYNLFLAIVVLLGIGLYWAGAGVVGITLVIAGTGIMLGAAFVLLGSNRRMLRAAAMQGGPPLLAIIAIVSGHVVS